MATFGCILDIVEQNKQTFATMRHCLGGMCNSYVPCMSCIKVFEHTKSIVNGQTNIKKKLIAHCIREAGDDAWQELLRRVGKTTQSQGKRRFSPPPAKSLYKRLRKDVVVVKVNAMEVARVAMVTKQADTNMSLANVANDVVLEMENNDEKQVGDEQFLCLEEFEEFKECKDYVDFYYQKVEAESSWFRCRRGLFQGKYYSQIPYDRKEFVQDCKQEVIGTDIAVSNNKIKHNFWYKSMFAFDSRKVWQDTKAKLSTPWEKKLAEVVEVGHQRIKDRGQIDELQKIWSMVEWMIKQHYHNPKPSFMSDTNALLRTNEFVPESDELKKTLQAKRRCDDQAIMDVIHTSYAAAKSKEGVSEVLVDMVDMEMEKMMKKTSAEKDVVSIEDADL